MQYKKANAPWWVKAILIVAGLYGIIWGTVMIAFPGLVFATSHLNAPQYRFIWQTVGLMELTFGAGDLMILENPYKFWRPLFLATAFKLFAALLFYTNASLQPDLFSMSSFVFMDNLVWAPFFTIILYKAYRHTYATDESLLEVFDETHYTLDMFEASDGRDLQQISNQTPTMVLFLRHFGCTFCRESLTDIARLRHRIEASGTQVVLVHMLEDEAEATTQLAKYGLQDIPAIADPEGILYKRFNLKRGTVLQLAGPKVWVRGLWAGVVKGHGLGAEMGDIWQMPGVFLLFKGEVIKSYVHNSAADRPSYLEMAQCEVCESEVA